MHNQHPIESRGSDWFRSRNPQPVVGRAPVPLGNMPRLSELDGPTVPLPRPAQQAMNGRGYVSVADRGRHANRTADRDRNTIPYETAPTWAVTA
jgi:hypothetical protein